MKSTRRICALLLTIALLLGVSGCSTTTQKGPLWEQPPTSLTLQGTDPLSFYADLPLPAADPTTIQLLHQLLSSREGAATIPPTAKDTPFAYAALLFPDQTTGTLQFYQKDDSFFASYQKSTQKKRSALFPIHTTDWLNFADHITELTLPQATFPTATLGGSNLSPRASSSYQYQRIDGSFHQLPPQEIGGNLPFPEFLMNITLDDLENGFPTLAFSSLPTSVQMNLEEYDKYYLYRSSIQYPKIIWSSDNPQLSATPDPTGHHFLQITAQYDSPTTKGTINYQTPVAFDPALAFSLDTTTYPGELIVIRAEGGTGTEEITTTTNLPFLPFEGPRFFSEAPGIQIAFVPISYHTSPASYQIAFSSGDQTEEFTLTVAEKEFPRQDLVVDESTTNETINSDQANAEFNREIGPVLRSFDTLNYWQESPFQWPLDEEGRITTEFGTVRYVNGALTSYRHDAIDIALPEGTSVYATNSGRVIYAGFLQLTGNTVVIEHGYGLKSWYYHMNQLDVVKNDMVTPSQLIGEIGSTGFSTGPHLHFGMSVQNVYINPWSLLDTTVLEPPTPD